MIIDKIVRKTGSGASYGVASENAVRAAAEETARVLVLGIGNVLVSDEGVGVHAVERLQSRGGLKGAAIVDGGTGGFTLLEYFHVYRRIVLIDAANDGKAPGTVSVLYPRFVEDFPPSLGAHDIGLRDLIVAAALTGELPQMRLVTVSIGDLTPMNTTLSPEVENALDGLLEVVAASVAEMLAEDPPSISP